MCRLPQTAKQNNAQNQLVWFQVRTDRLCSQSEAPQWKNSNSHSWPGGSAHSPEQSHTTYSTSNLKGSLKSYTDTINLSIALESEKKKKYLLYTGVSGENRMTRRRRGSRNVSILITLLRHAGIKTLLNQYFQISPQLIFKSGTTLLKRKGCFVFLEQGTFRGKSNGYIVLLILRENKK